MNAVILLTAIDAGTKPAAEAHAIIVSAQPAVNSTVARGTMPIRLLFNSRIDVAHSRLSLQRPDGKVENVGLASGAADDSLAGLANVQAEGRWTLHWLVLSLDGHITRGEVSFFVRGA